MSNRDDESYYRQRAQREREMAGSCQDNGAALAHLRMAEEYERRVQPEVEVRVAT
jgi:hypothetical protein